VTSVPDHPWCVAGIGSAGALGAAAGYRAGRRKRQSVREPTDIPRGTPPRPSQHGRAGRRGGPTMRSWPGWRLARRRRGSGPPDNPPDK